MNWEAIGAVGEVLGGFHIVEIGHLKASVLQELLFQQAVLRHFQGLRRRIKRHLTLQVVGCGKRHVFKLIGDHIAGILQLIEGFSIVIGRNDVVIANLGRRTAFAGFQNNGSKAQPGGAARQHAGQLTASDNADRGVWPQRRS